MSQVTDPIILNSTGQDIASALTGLAMAIASKPDPATQTPVMDGAGDVGTSTKYAREDHQHPSDTSKANQTQLAYVESGTTASRAYAVGEYFCWNGMLYRAKTAISSGGTFTPGTNCEQVTGGGLNSITKTEVITSECVINDSILISNNVRVSVSGNTLVISGNTRTNVNGTNILSITLPSRLAYATRAYFYIGAYGGTFIGEGYVEDHYVRMNISTSSNNGVFNVVTTLN